MAFLKKKKKRITTNLAAFQTLIYYLCFNLFILSEKIICFTILCWFLPYYLFLNFTHFIYLLTLSGLSLACGIFVGSRRWAFIGLFRLCQVLVSHVGPSLAADDGPSLGSLVGACKLTCPVACGVLVPSPGMLCPLHCKADS